MESLALEAAAFFTRRLLHGGHDEEEEETLSAPPPSATAFGPAGFNAGLATAPAFSDEHDQHQSTHTLKWVFAAVIFLESLLGLLLPLLISWRRSFFAAPAFLSLLNCFAGGVFLTFGIMHLLPDAAADARALGLREYPTAYLFCAVGFFAVFFVQKVLSPLLMRTQPDGHEQPFGGGTCCSHGASHIIGDAQHAAEKPAGGYIPPPGHHRTSKDSDEELGKGAQEREPCDCNQDPKQARMLWLMWIAPAVLFAGLCVHSVFEGLAVGLQDSNAGVVTVAVAMIVHKWVESLALSSMCIRAGARWWHLLLVLVPFGVMGFVGVAIGVSVTDSSTWAEMVLFALIAGGFIYVGGYEIVHGEFTANCTDRPFSRIFRVIQYVFMFLGALLVALLQLVHGS